MLFAQSAQKTLSDMIRDYRQGALTNPPGISSKTDLPGYGYIYGITDSPYLSYAPGDIVPLITESPSPSENFPDHDLDDETYQNLALFGPTSQIFRVQDMPEEPSDLLQTEYNTPIEVYSFGIAKEYVSREQYGIIQVSGCAWVLFEDIPDLEIRRKFVVLRRNSRHGGKPFLQAAADGTAEIIRTDTTRKRDDGLTWGLVKLSIPYRGTLSACPEDIESMEPFKRVFCQHQTEGRYSSNWNEWKHQAIGEVWTVSGNLTPNVPFLTDYIMLIDYYDSEKKNFVRTKRVQELDSTSFSEYIYIDRDTGEITSHPIQHDELNLTQWPDFIKTYNYLQPFTGGIFPGKCISKDEIVVLGRTLPRSQLITKEENVDIWPGDYFYVRIFNKDPSGYFNFPYELVHCPKDDPIGTKILTIDNCDLKRLDRGWVFVDIHQKFKETYPTIEYSSGTKIGVLTGGNYSFNSYISHHRHSDDGDVAHSDPGWDSRSQIDLINVFGTLGYWEKVEVGMTF